MDQSALVILQMDEGKQLINQLLAEGVPVTGAGWLKETENDQWYLYLVTPLVSKDGATKGAYRRVNHVLGQMTELSNIRWLEIKVIAPTDPVAQAILDVRGRYPGKRTVAFRGSQLGGVHVEGAYIYSFAT
jgi:hypothetical protein